jgi:cytochrome c-type biogenesis protein
MTIGSIALAFVAGVLSILSPCVLPIVPVVLGTASSDHRWAPAALAAGLAASFVAVGLFVATIGHAIGLGEQLFRDLAAILAIAVGGVLVLPGAQARLAMASGPLVHWTDQHFGNVRGADRSGLSGQFLLGVLLGAVWSPCVGPTLGAASLLAAQGRDLPTVAVTMFAFGLGAAVPLLALGWLSREALMRWRGRLIAAGRGLRTVLGLLLIAIGVLVLSRLDRVIEAALVDASPQWLTDLSTRF